MRDVRSTLLPAAEFVAGAVTAKWIRDSIGASIPGGPETPAGVDPGGSTSGTTAAAAPTPLAAASMLSRSSLLAKTQQPYTLSSTGDDKLVASERDAWLAPTS